MTDAQTMKLTESVSDYFVKEDDNIHHIEKAGKPPEGANNQQNFETEVLIDQKTGNASIGP